MEKQKDEVYEQYMQQQERINKNPYRRMWIARLVVLIVWIIEIDMVDLKQKIVASEQVQNFDDAMSLSYDFYRLFYEYRKYMLYIFGACILMNLAAFVFGWIRSQCAPVLDIVVSSLMIAAPLITGFGLWMAGYRVDIGADMWKWGIVFGVTAVILLLQIMIYRKNKAYFILQKGVSRGIVIVGVTLILLESTLPLTRLIPLHADGILKTRRELRASVCSELEDQMGNYRYDGMSGDGKIYVSDNDTILQISRSGVTKQLYKEENNNRISSIFYADGVVYFSTSIGEVYRTFVQEERTEKIYDTGGYSEIAVKDGYLYYILKDEYYTVTVRRVKITEKMQDAESELCMRIDYWHARYAQLLYMGYLYGDAGYLDDWDDFYDANHNIAKDGYYYYRDDNLVLKQVRKEDRSEQVITEHCTAYNIQGDYIYFVTTTNIHKYILYRAPLSDVSAAVNMAEFEDYVEVIYVEDGAVAVRYHSLDGEQWKVVKPPK